MFSSVQINIFTHVLKKTKGRGEYIHTNFTFSFCLGQVHLVLWHKTQLCNCFGTVPFTRFHHRAKHHYTYFTSVKHVRACENQRKQYA